MPTESVVDALRVIHRTLRPGGVLLDLHASEAVSPVRTLFRGHATAHGAIEWSPMFQATVSLAEEALARAEAAGDYGNEQQSEYQVENHFLTAGEWAEFRAAQGPYYEPVGDGLVTAVERAMEPVGSELLMGEVVRATRYRRLG